MFSLGCEIWWEGVNGGYSAKELEHYQRVREQFEKAEDEESKKKGKGKGKGKAIESSPELEIVDRKGKGKTLMINHKDGSEVEDAGLGSGVPRLQLDLSTGSSADGASKWEDVAEGDEEELYGDGGS